MRYCANSYICSIYHKIEPIVYPPGVHRRDDKYIENIFKIDDFDPRVKFKNIRLSKTREGRWKLSPSFTRCVNSIKWDHKWNEDDLLLSKSEYDRRHYYGIFTKFKNMYVVATVRYSITWEALYSGLLDYRVAETDFYIYTAINSEHNAILDCKRVMSCVEKEAINSYQKLDTHVWMIDNSKNKTVSFLDQPVLVNTSKLSMLMSNIINTQLDDCFDDQIFIPRMGYKTFKHIIQLIMAFDLDGLCKYHRILDYLDSAWLALLIDQINEKYKDYHPID